MTNSSIHDRRALQLTASDQASLILLFTFAIAVVVAMAGASRPNVTDSIKEPSTGVVSIYEIRPKATNRTLSLDLNEKMLIDRDKPVSVRSKYNIAVALDDSRNNVMDEVKDQVNKSFKISLTEMASIAGQGTEDPRYIARIDLKDALNTERQMISEELNVNVQDLFQDLMEDVKYTYAQAHEKEQLLLAAEHAEERVKATTTQLVLDELNHNVDELFHSPVYVANSSKSPSGNKQRIHHVIKHKDVEVVTAATNP